MKNCPRCGEKLSEEGERCEKCGLNIKKYLEKEREKEDEQNDEYTGYTSGYNAFLVILGILIFFGGLILKEESVTMMIVSWIGGTILLVMMNMLKNIVEELRILNDKIN